MGRACWRESIRRQHASERVYELLGALGNISPSLAGEPAGDQGPQQPPGAGRPFDQAFVDVMSPRRCMIAPAGKPKVQCRHSRLLLLGRIVGRVILACIAAIGRFLALLQFVLERHRGVNHHLLAAGPGRLDSRF